jgi:hypothetical protein
MAYKITNKKKIDSVDTPCKKTIYNSKEEAQDIIDYILENRGGPELYPYKCTICGFWHLTSKTK